MGQPSHRSASLMDVLDRVLDKGIVIDATVRVSLVGIDLLGVDAQITVASIETYLQLSEDPRAYDLGLIAGGTSTPVRGEKTALPERHEPKRVEAGSSSDDDAPVAEPESPPGIAARGEESSGDEMR